MTKAHFNSVTARSFVLAAPFLAILCALPCAAQVRGLVMDRSERPVAGALVELWNLSRRTASAQTDQQGRFEIPGGPSEERLMLTVRRLGLATQTVHLTSRDTTLRIAMDVQAAAMRPVIVEASAGRLCPRREDPQARQLWTRMRGRYWQPGSDSVFVFSFLEIRSGTGEKDDARDPEAGRTSEGWTTGALIVAHPEYMVRSGYAQSAAGGAGERTAFWIYRALDGGMMQDFTGEHFGAVHTLSILSQSADQTTIVFCPRDRLRRLGQIQGTLVLRADTTLSYTRWTFQTQEPREDAGGEASYLPPNPALGNALLARETAFWRKSGAAYYFESNAYAGWSRWFRAEEPTDQP